MKILFSNSLLFLIGLISLSCSSENKKTENDFKLLEGDWIITAVLPRPDDKEIAYTLESLFDVYAEVYSFVPVKFADNKLYFAEGFSKHQVDTFSYSLNVDSALIRANKDGENYPFKILSISKDTLKLSLLDQDSFGNTKVDIDFLLLKVRNPESVFIARSLHWKKLPVKEESVDEIKARLVSLLSYNHTYIRNIYYSSANILNTRKLMLPLKYYNGGLGLKSLEESEEFASLFYNKNDAQIAYLLLQDAFTRFNYPQKSNYFLEYAEFFHLMTVHLQNDNAAISLSKGSF